MGVRRIEVARPGPDRLSALAPVFGGAFVEEPMPRWPMGGHGGVVDRSRAVAYFVEAVLELGVVWEADDANGAGVWVPPDRSGAWEGHPWNQPRISALTDDGGRRYDAFWNRVDSHSPAEPLWQLEARCRRQVCGRKDQRVGHSPSPSTRGSRAAGSERL